MGGGGGGESSSSVMSHAEHSVISQGSSSFTSFPARVACFKSRKEMLHRHLHLYPPWMLNTSSGNPGLSEPLKIDSKNVDAHNSFVIP